MEKKHEKQGKWLIRAKILVITASREAIFALFLFVRGEDNITFENYGFRAKIRPFLRFLR
jgi:hypothetical protein